jgi:peroxiredoxin
MNRRNWLKTAGGIMVAAPSLLAAPKLPRPAPEFAVTLNSGEQLLLSKFRGKVVALEILLTTCPHCQQCSGLLQKNFEEFGPRGFQPIGAAINENARNLVPEFISKFGLKFPVGVAPNTMAYDFLQLNPALGAPIYMPQLVFIDRQGIIRAQYGGTDIFFEKEEENMRTQILSLLGPATSKPASKKS